MNGHREAARSPGPWSFGFPPPNTKMLVCSFRPVAPEQDKKALVSGQRIDGRGEAPARTDRKKGDEVRSSDHLQCRVGGALTLRDGSGMLRPGTASPRMVVTDASIGLVRPTASAERWRWGEPAARIAPAREADRRPPLTARIHGALLHTVAAERRHPNRTGSRTGTTPNERATSARLSHVTAIAR